MPFLLNQAVNNGFCKKATLASFWFQISLKLNLRFKIQVSRFTNSKTSTNQNDVFYILKNFPRCTIVTEAITPLKKILLKMYENIALTQAFCRKAPGPSH